MNKKVIDLLEKALQLLRTEKSCVQVDNPIVIPSPNMPSVALDAGHGGKDSGAVSVLGFSEKKWNLEVAKKVTSLLKSSGYNVGLTRNGDTFIDLSDRATIANKANPEVFISIHFNSAKNNTARGIETFHYYGSVDGKELATCIQNELIKNFPLSPNRGVKEAGFVVTRDTNMPAVLVECEFGSNYDGALQLQNNQTLYAKAIADGIIKYLER